MKRDMDLVRKIILAIRKSDDVLNGIDGIDKKQFAAYVELLDEAKLVVAILNKQGKKTAKEAVIIRLTWAGQDFADSIISDTLWNKAKENVINPASSWTFSVLLRYIEIEICRNIPGLN